VLLRATYSRGLWRTIVGGEVQRYIEKARGAFFEKTSGVVRYPGGTVPLPYYVARFDSWVPGKDPCTAVVKV
jgi:hypothetical protein